MTEEQTQESETEQVAPEGDVQQHVEDSDQSQPHVETSNDYHDDVQERNWRQARQQMREQQAMLKAQQELIDRLQSQGHAPPTQDELDTLDESEYLNAGRMKKLIAKEAERIAADRVQAAMAEQEKSRFHERLKSKFSDFDSVVTPESLSLLEEEDPELAEVISQVSDPYKAGLQVYKYLKNSPILEKLPSRRRKKEVENKLKKNENSVPSPAQFQNRPMAQAFTMAEEDPSKLWQEMQKYASMGSGY